MMMELDFELTDDVALDNVLHEAQSEIQATNDFLLPDMMVHEAVHNACEFFNLPEIPIMNSDGVCVWANETETVFDDVFGFSRGQMMEMGISGEDSLTLVYTHECAHRALQNYEGIEGKSEELACDFFAGIHAEIGDMDTEQLSSALGKTAESDTHPAGELRVEAMEFGKTVAREMAAQGVPLTFENCMERFDTFLSEHIDSSLTDTTTNEVHIQGEPISFGSAYSAEEYVSKAKNCYHEAEIYEDRATRSDDKYEIKHNLEEARKWQQRGDEYMRDAKYANK